VGYVPHGEWERLTIAAGLRLDGGCGALAYQGSTTAETCEAFCSQCLAPELRPGDIVIMDRLSSHTDLTVLAPLRAGGCR
jgi:hypothetical protein